MKKKYTIIALLFLVSLSIAVTLVSNTFEYSKTNNTRDYLSSNNPDWQTFRESCTITLSLAQDLLKECQNIADDNLTKCANITTTSQCVRNYINSTFLQNKTFGTSVCGRTLNWTANITLNDDGFNLLICKAEELPTTTTTIPQCERNQDCPHGQQCRDGVCV